MPTADQLSQWARTVQHRAAAIEAVDSEKRELYVKAAPYSVMTDIGGGIDEEFLPGSFSRAAAAPEKLLVWHDHGGPMVGRGVAVDDRGDGVWVRSRLASTSAARDMASLIEEKFLRDVSVEFVPMPGWMQVERVGERVQVRHRRAHLRGFAVVPEGAYGPENAFVASMRDGERDRAAEAERLWLQEYRSRSL